MTKPTTLLVLVISLFFTSFQAFSADDKELRKQRQTAQNERKLEKKERTSQNREAVKAFKAFAKEQKAEYKEKLADLKMEFQLKEVELKAEHKTKVASAVAEYQKQLMDLFVDPDENGFDQAAIEKFLQQIKAYSDELFVLKKQSAENVHNAWKANEVKKNSLLNERDDLIVSEAETLGLTKDFSPIIAKQIGGELTKSEQRWNESEEKAVKKLKQQNLKQLNAYLNGEKLRDLELKYKEDDFKLLWQQKEELQAIDSNAGFYNLLLMQTGQQEMDQQAFINEVAESNKKKQLIEIKYKQLASKNKILRKKEKKEILKL